MHFKLILLLFVIGIFQLDAQDGPGFPGQENCDIPFTIETTPSDCNDANGSVTFNLQAIVFPITGGIILNGSPNYSFYNSNVISFTDLAPGSYRFKFVDRFGCVAEGKFKIEQSFIIQRISQTGCAPDATAIILLSGGERPYTSDNPNFTQFSTGSPLFIFRGLDAGDHDFVFRDANDCIVTASFTVAEELSAQVVNVGGCAPEGFANILLSGGTPPYPDGGLFYNPLVTLQGLSSGIQTHTLTDSNGCSVDVTFEIEDELEIVDLIVEPSTCINNGQVGIEISGGVAPYTVLSNFEPFNSDTQQGIFEYVDMSPGDYSWSFVDSRGCELLINFTIENRELKFVQSVTEPSDCFNNGSAIITIEGGFPPYNGPNGTVNNTGVFELTGLSAGFHPLQFVDSRGCELWIEIEIDYLETPCCQFTFTRTEKDNESTTDEHPDAAGQIIYRTTEVSDVSATIRVAFGAECVPHRIKVTVNNVVVMNVVDGLGACISGNPIQSFSVEPGDIVVFEVIEDICPESHSCDVVFEDEWIFSVSCTEDEMVNSDDYELLSFRSSEPQSSSYMKSIEQEKSIKIYPNPVSNVLRIDNTDATHVYKNIRIMDSSGNLIETKNITDNNKLELEVTTYPQGLYIIELIDEIGNRIVKRFTKIN